MKVDFPKSGGLCNRLKGLVSLFQLASDEELSIYWPPVIRPNYDKRIDFDWMLDNKVTLRDKPKESNVGDWETINSLKRVYVTEEDVPSDFASYNPVIEHPCPCVDFEYERIPQKVRDRLIPYFKRLQFKPEILEKADQLTKQIFTEPLIGVHIRNDSLWNSVRFWQPLKLYFEAVDKLDSKDRLFVVSHNKDSYNQFVKRYGKRVITIPDTIYDGNNKEFIQQCMVKILLLGKCHTVIFDRNSSIPEVAWWLGECKFKPIFIRNDKKWGKR